MNFDIKGGARIAIFGAIGGALGWLLAYSNGIEVASIDLLLFPVLGAGASVIFVVLIANTDRTDELRVIALALVSGMFFRPVFDAAEALIDQHRDDRLEVEAKQNLDAAQALLTAPPDDLSRPEVQQRVTDYLLAAKSAASRMSRASPIAEIQAEAVDLGVAADLPDNEIIKELPLSTAPYLRFDRRFVEPVAPQ